MKKERLDKLVARMHSDLTRTQIQQLIAAGYVTVNGKVSCKPGVVYPRDASITVAEQALKTLFKYVSRAGFKLEKALEHFAIDPTGYVALDAGLSTGGFTDCLLQHGVRTVYGIDVGSEQVSPRIAQDSRVKVRENCDIRTVSLPELVDIITLDLSFISLTKVLAQASAHLKPHGILIMLIKPQFEVGRHNVGRGGLVTNVAAQEHAIAAIQTAAQQCNLKQNGEIIQSPLKGQTSGNTEFLACFIKGITPAV